MFCSPIGNIYIGDYKNHRVRKVTVSTDIITTIAGSGGTGSYSGDDGQATSATLYYPAGVAIDASGNVYIADYTNNRIRKVTVSTGIITTFVGTGTQSFSGDGGAATSATLAAASGLAFDSSGKLLPFTKQLHFILYFFKVICTSQSSTIIESVKLRR